MRTEIKPLSRETLADFLRFFDDVGFTDNPDWSACYCCFYHLDPAKGPFEKRTREENRTAAREMIQSGRMKGLLAYRDGGPVGWCNINAKSAYSLLATDPLLADSDVEKTNSIVCVLVAPGFRRQGIARQLLDRACSASRDEGLSILEAYPRKKANTSATHYHGPISMYRRAGFTVHRETDDLWIVRRPL
jgi:GNAT superfamily N-acetyltransferase